jgi:hypothetical protein
LTGRHLRCRTSRGSHRRRTTGWTGWRSSSRTGGRARRRTDGSHLLERVAHCHLNCIRLFAFLGVIIRLCVFLGVIIRLFGNFVANLFGNLLGLLGDLVRKVSIDEFLFRIVGRRLSLRSAR